MVGLVTGSPVRSSRCSEPVLQNSRSLKRQGLYLCSWHQLKLFLRCRWSRRHHSSDSSIVSPIHLGEMEFIILIFVSSFRAKGNVQKDLFWNLSLLDSGRLDFYFSEKYSLSSNLDFFSIAASYDTAELQNLQVVLCSLFLPLSTLP